MKKTLVRGLLACSLGACGGGSQDETGAALPEPGPSYESEEVFPAEEAATLPASQLVDRVQRSQQTIEFWNAGTADEPTILITTIGDAHEGELRSEFEAQIGESVSAAELWRAATGRDEVPELLALEHQASGLGAYRDYDPNEVQKAAFNFATLFPLPASTTSNCWAGSSTSTTQMPSSARGTAGRALQGRS